MKKVMLVMLVLAVCGVLHNSVLAQEMESRYLVTYWRSLTDTEIRSVTVVTVVNQSDLACNVQVEWFLSSEALFGIPVGISGPQPVNGGGIAFHSCSRNVRDTIVSCSSGGVSDPPILGTTPGINQGKALVSSTAGPDCSRIAVDARVYYTTGKDDTAISAISNSKVVFFGEGNLGD